MKEIVALLIFIVCIESSASLTAPVAFTGQPALQAWSTIYSNLDLSRPKFNVIGSGSGLSMNQTAAGTVDFGGTNIPIPDDFKFKDQIVQFPLLVSAMVISANVPGVKDGQLVLSADIIAQAYLTQKMKWNDQRIKDLNPELNLPDLPIYPIGRADVAGTTADLCEYLTSTSAGLDHDQTYRSLFKEKFGSRATVPFGVLNARDMGNMAAMIKQTKGALGYVDIVTADRGHLMNIGLVDDFGNKVFPTKSAISAGVEKIKWTESSCSVSATTGIVSASGAWPLLNPFYMILSKNVALETRTEVQNFLDWERTSQDAEKASDELGMKSLVGEFWPTISEKIFRDCFNKN